MLMISDTLTTQFEIRHSASAILFGLSLLLAATPGQASEQIQWSGDVRSGYFSSEKEQRNGSKDNSEELRARLRWGGTLTVSPGWQLGARFAGQLSNNQEDTHAGLSFSSTSAGLNRGDATLDQLYARYQQQHWGITLGRMQTSFKLDGVAPKSLDRNDSNNMNITYTDGVHAWTRVADDWRLHSIVQYNASKGSGGIRRTPLHFEDDASRLSAFFSLENKTPVGPLQQRAVSLNYLPQSLENKNSLKDYWALTASAAAGWPLPRSRRLLVGLQLGYAPETPDLPQAKNTGFAWQASLNLYDVMPNQNIALVAGSAAAGWLLSPGIQSNREMLELRYQWKINRRAKLEARIRHRREINTPLENLDRQQDADFYLRYTHKM